MTTEGPEEPRSRVGVLGGTFDPPHAGHLAAARTALEALALDHVVFVVAADPWQKRGAVVASPGDRYEMVRRLVEGESRMSVSTIEIERAGPSYTVDTLEALSRPEGRIWLPEELRGQEPELYLIVGADAAAGLPSWHRAECIPDLARIVLVTRPDEGVKVPPPFPHLSVEMVPVPVSSTQIRESLEGGDTPAGLSGAVLDFIRERGLYGSRA